VYLYLLCFVLFVLCFCIVSFMCIYSYLLVVQGLLPQSDNSIAIDDDDDDNNNNYYYSICIYYYNYYYIILYIL